MVAGLLGALGSSATGSDDWYEPFLNPPNAYSLGWGLGVDLCFPLCLVAVHRLLRGPITALWRRRSRLHGEGGTADRLRPASRWSVAAALIAACVLGGAVGPATTSAPAALWKRWNTAIRSSAAAGPTSPVPAGR
ncbi:hypothetical protein ACFU53_00045 [Streptomyces sp. NPDC057474]|uniref:hypothetical protein n=1 Tax=Streptomyces sp. NPDC057474 TaxID=3346144 RepID=UPI0036A319AD